MHHFVTEMCTFLLQNRALRNICLMHCGICEMCLFFPADAAHHPATSGHVGVIRKPSAYRFILVTANLSDAEAVVD